jgi:hypothetical protein
MSSNVKRSGMSQVGWAVMISRREYVWGAVSVFEGTPSPRWGILGISLLDSLAYRDTLPLKY